MIVKGALFEANTLSVLVIFFFVVLFHCNFFLATVDGLLEILLRNAELTMPTD